MANTVNAQVGGIYYTLDLDTRTFEVKAKDASAKLTSLKGEFQSAEDASKKFATAMAVGAAAALAGIGYGVKVAADLETARQGYITLLGSAQAADDALAMIKSDAAKTPFELPGLVQANQMLTQITKDAGRSESLLLNVGKALAAAGKGQPELDRVILNLQQIGNTSKITEMDVRQFGNAGVNILELLAEYYGVSKSAASDMVKDSKTAFTDLEGAFEKAGSAGGRFSRSFIDQAGTFNQLMSNLKDSVGIALSDILTKSGVFDAIKSTLSNLVNYIVDNTPAMIESVKTFVKFVQDNFPLIAGVILGALIPAFTALITSLASGLVLLSPYIILGGALALAFTAISQSVFGANSGLTGFIGLLQIAFTLIKGVTTSLMYLITGQFSKVGDTISTTVGEISNIVKSTNQKIVDSTKKTTTAQVAANKKKNDDIIAADDQLTSEQKKQLADEEYNFKKSMDKRKQSFQDSLAQLVYAHLDKVTSLKKQLSDENKDFSDKMAARVKDFEESMDEMKKSHEDKVKDLKDQLTEENADFAASQAERNATAQAEIADETKSHEKKVDDIQTLIDKEVAKGKNASSLKLATLREELAQENSDYSDKVDKINADVDKQSAKEMDANQKSLADLQKKLDEENQSYLDSIAKKTATEAEQTTTLQTEHDKRTTDLQTSLDTENGILAKHQEDVNALKDQARLDDIEMLKKQYAEENAAATADHLKKINDITTQGQQQGSTLGSNINTGLASQKGALNNTMAEIGRSLSSNLVSNIGDGAKQAGAKILKDFANGLIQKAKDLMGNWGFNIGISAFMPSVALALNTLAKMPMLASGATNFPGGSAIVGENGPEIVNIPRGADVIPNMGSLSDMQSMLGGGNKNKVNQNISVYVDRIQNESDIDSLGREFGFRASLNR